jgi:hypothetical protein
MPLSPPWYVCEVVYFVMRWLVSTNVVICKLLKEDVDKNKMHASRGLLEAATAMGGTVVTAFGLRRREG